MDKANGTLCLPMVLALGISEGKVGSDGGKHLTSASGCHARCAAAQTLVYTLTSTHI